MNLVSSEIPGLVWAYHFLPGESRCRRIPADSPVSALKPDEGWVWVHLALSDARTPALLERICDLPAGALATLGSHDTQAAIAIEDDVVHGTLVDFERTFDTETKTIAWLHFAVAEKIIVTTRLHPLRSIDRVKAAIEKNPRCAKPIHLFEMMVVEFQRTLIGLVLELTEDLNVIEDAVYGEAGHNEQPRLAPLRRTAVRLHRHLRTLLALLRRAATSEEDEVPEGFIDVAERLSDRLESVDRDVFALQERARLLHEEIDSKLSSETNRHLYILSLLTAFLLPPTLVTGFFGMNTSDMPLAGTLHHGTSAAAFFIILSMVVAWIILRRVGIL
ncbi:transporter [Rhizobium rhizosphaerae]|uniref:Transporter n=1 Tax=Xaviernesmea rhizosphaerae TaxID=1672749 RepID=A0A1Q9AH02_9HYPH|nr:transporter [Xaviernesmea rhizosphaerae]OLP54488.1 transporter [Xaviernesmea rhizosphaerae]OQP83914.1 transporter [Xaviernesmea rhizosphaerae]